MIVLSSHCAHVVHFIFEWLGVLVGVRLYSYIKRRHWFVSADAPVTTDFFTLSNLVVVIGCLLGAGIGNKLLFVLEVPQAWALHGVWSLAYGQTIVGGLIGAWIGIELAKRLVSVRYSTGDAFVVPFCVGLCIGRIGCFLAGLHDGTYGVATSLPWGVDFGDGVRRHPTQIYDMLWCIAMLIIVRHAYPRWRAVSGLTFKVMMAGYLIWRLLVDGIKPVPYAYAFGWSAIQWACALVLVVYLPLLWHDVRRLPSLAANKH